MAIFISLLQFIFEIYLYILLIRLLLQKLGESWSNPISQIVVTLTEPIVKPLRKFIPGFKGFDLAIVVAVFVINLVEVLLVFKIKVGVMPAILGSMIIAIGYIGYKLINIYIWGVILSVIMSWISALQHNPLASVINTIARPLMHFVGRYIPKIGGIDFSPIPLLLALWLMKLVVFHPILVYGLRLAY